MAATTIATSHNLTVTQCENSLVQVKRDLSKEAGDAIVFGLSGILSGAGVAGNNVLGTGDTTNEEAMEFFNQRLVIDQIRNGTRIAGLMDSKRTAFSLRESAKTQLTDWMAYNEDAALFTAVNTADIVLTAHTTGTGVTVDAIIDMKKEAMFPTFGNVDATGGSEITTRKIKPIKLNMGEEVFVLGISPADAASLKKSDDFQTYQHQGNVRGDKNPIFTGSLGVINGVVIHEHSSFAAGAPVLMGAQALFLGYANEILYREDQFDYDNQSGFMIGSVRGVAIAKFLDESDVSQGSHGAIKFNTAT